MSLKGNSRKNNLDQLFSVKNILSARGFDIRKEDKENNLLIKNIRQRKYPNGEHLFRIFNDFRKRKELLHAITHSKKTSSDKEVRKLINHAEFAPDRNKFSYTFEWYMGELVVRRFSAFAYSYGVEVEDVQRNETNTYAGDYDVLVVLRNLNLIYIECKTGKFNRESILKSVGRSLALHCDFVIIMIDNPIHANQLHHKLKGADHPLLPLHRLNQIQTKGNDASLIYDWMNCYLLTSSGNIEEQIKTVLRINQAKKILPQYMFGYENHEFEQLGYTIKTLV
ncbi:hypothetical protein [Microscilla marina]|uniref:Uncharacterized protein n=1 Tax=Microscilla marina ATCC 23134 TaxID=313606 RepID=A1ZCH5_MICM2|nr:hypothetical protein [Microscilla marina]EAY31977.1 hypothetical protein M23134_02006 [Microscilla marina ATCC 23134]